MKLYIAGPVFTQAERRWNRQFAEVLRHVRPDWRVFLPQDEVAPAIHGGTVDLPSLFGICIRGLQDCDVVVAVLDGCDAESGTSFECGYAFSAAKPVIGVRTDLRNGEDRGMNAMLSESCQQVVRFPSTDERIDKLAELVLRALDHIASARKS